MRKVCTRERCCASLFWEDRKVTSMSMKLRRAGLLRCKSSIYTFYCNSSSDKQHEALLLSSNSPLSRTLAAHSQREQRQKWIKESRDLCSGSGESEAESRVDVTLRARDITQWPSQPIRAGHVIPEPIRAQCWGSHCAMATLRRRLGLGGSLASVAGPVCRASTWFHHRSCFWLTHVATLLTTVWPH